MSIDATRVVRVLLADGWHDVARGSFHATLETWRFGDEVTGEAGFKFRSVETGRRVTGPLGSLVAVTEEVRDE